MKKEEILKIVEEIKSNLTDDKEENKKYLSEMMKKYGDNKELGKEISRLIFNELDEDTKNEFSTLLNEEVFSINKKAYEYLIKKDYKKAKEEYLKFIKLFPTNFEEDKLYRYICPSNMFEEELIKKYNEGKEFKNIGFDLDKTYYYLGFISVEENNNIDAENYLLKAIELNPAYVDARFELINLYRGLHYFEKAKIELEETYKYIFYPQHLARYYRDYGFIASETKNYELAKSLYIFSYQFDKNSLPIVENEMKYIFEVSKDESIPKDIIDVLIKNKVNILIHQDTLKLLIKHCLDIEKNDEIDENYKEFIKSLLSFYKDILK